jgi:hypothetical protein
VNEGYIMGGIGHSPDFQGDRKRLLDEKAAPYIAPKREADMVKAVAEALDRERRARDVLEDVVRHQGRRIEGLNTTIDALVARIARLEKRLDSRHAE